MFNPLPTLILSQWAKQFDISSEIKLVWILDTVHKNEYLFLHWNLNYFLLKKDLKQLNHTSCKERFSENNLTKKIWKIYPQNLNTTRSIEIVPRGGPPIFRLMLMNSVCRPTSSWWNLEADPFGWWILEVDPFWGAVSWGILEEDLPFWEGWPLGTIYMDLSS